MSRRLAMPVLAILVPLTAGCAMDARNSAKAWPGAEAKLFDSAGQEAGYVLLNQKGKLLSGVVHVTGMTPGLHGIHIHAVGKCEGPDFKTAGGHLNPGNRQHGLDNPMGAHMGDLPNLSVGPDGAGHATFETGTSLADVLDDDGSAFIVHATADDNRTDPSGNSGARLLCGILAARAN
jgi:Cu-Zn family superoxide dismutase